MRRSSFFLPRLLVSLNRTEANLQYPLERNLVPIICQLREIPSRLEATPFNRFDVEIAEIDASLEFSGQSLNVMKIEQVTAHLKTLIQPELWKNRVKLNADVTIQRAEVQLNPAQFYLTSNLLQSMVNNRVVDVLNTSLLADISNQQLVVLRLNWEKILCGFDESDDYRIIQLEIGKMDGHAVIPTLKTTTHILEWPCGKIGRVYLPNFLSIVYQTPLHSAAMSCPPIIDVRMQAGGVSLDSLMCRFLNYDVKRWTYPIYETHPASSKSDTAIVLDTPIKKGRSVEPRIPPAIASVQSSSDRDANTSMIVETDEAVEDERGLNNLFQFAKHLVVQVDIGETIIYFPSKLMKCSVFNAIEVNRSRAFQDNDCLVIG